MIYRFFQAAAVGVSALVGFGVLALLWLTSWLWCFRPVSRRASWFSVALRWRQERRAKPGSGRRNCGHWLGDGGIGRSVYGSIFDEFIAKQRHEKETRQANEEVASVVKAAQESFDKGDLDKAETELQRVPLVAKATDTKAAGLLQEKIRAARQEAAIRKANRDVLGLVRRLKWIFLPADWKPLKRNCPRHWRSRSRRHGEGEGASRQNSRETPGTRERKGNEAHRRRQGNVAGHFDKAHANSQRSDCGQRRHEHRRSGTLLGQMGTLSPNCSLHDAERAIRARQYSVAAKRLKAYLVNPRSEKKSEATQMLKMVELVLDTGKCKASLKSMSDGQIKSLSEGGKPPDDLATTNAALSEAVKASFSRYVPQERNRRQAELEAAQANAPEALAKLNAEREEKRQAETGNKVEAWVAAQNIVEKRLKSPSTASFGGLFSGQTSDTCVTALGDRRYRVKGWVDSLNSFGATVRADFSMVLQEDDSGNWRSHRIL